MDTSFKLDGEYIELVKLLKALGWADTGGQAKVIIDSGMVMVDDRAENRKRGKIRRGQVVSYDGNRTTIV